MKFGLISDLHLEYISNNDYNIPNNNLDCLILAGDILYIRDILSGKYDNFLFEELKKFKKVIYVLGNHEHYKYKEIYENISILKDYVKNSNIVVLENEEYFLFNKIKIYGCTLWSNLNNQNLELAYSIKDKIYDLNNIANFNLNTWLEYNKITYNNLINFLNKNKNNKIIIISHFSPSKLSIDKKYLEDIKTNICYFSDYNELFNKYENILYWCHGHTHNQIAYSINKTKIVCNAKGYPIETKEHIKPFEFNII